MKYKQSRSSDIRESLIVRLPADYGWKVLNQLVLDLGYLLTESENRLISGIIRNRDYDAYLLLSEVWGPQSMTTWGTKPAVMRAKYQIATLLKKFRFPSDNATRRSAAKQKMLEAEMACEAYNRSGYMDLIWARDDRMCNVYTYARSFLSKLLGEALPAEGLLTHWSRHGPGANLDTKERQISQYFKYQEWPYSCTEAAVPLARSAIKEDERWLGALEDSYRAKNNVPAHMILDQGTFWSSVLKVVPGNRIAFVPKNAQTDRSIAIEPSMNLYLQLGVDGYIRKRLKRWDIDLDSQAKNRELARLGSRDWDWNSTFCTLDLKAASDSVSIEVCRALLPKCWFNYLMKLRSPEGSLDGETIQYSKISSMGNGYTFALETSLFAAIVFGVQREFQGKLAPADCAIYGDDIIVKKEIVQPVIQALNLCGFTINGDKSFLEGPFRESCGADWFMGTPVRPVFLECLPTTVMELWCDLNRIKRILSLRYLVEDSKTESLLNTWIPSKMRGITGPYSDEDFDSYRHVPTPSGRHSNCLWHWKRVVVIPRPQKVTNFLFGKLMHDLRGGPLTCTYKSPRDAWRGCKMTGAGSRFTVTKPGSVAVSTTYSVADFWRSEYAEI